MKKLLLILSFLLFGVGLYAEKLYWVGGSGTFNDAKHWSRVSGGKGGSKTPDFSDDVVFDAKSFGSLKNLSISLNAIQTCKNLEVLVGDRAISFEGIETNILKVNGNFLLSKNTSWNSKGTLELLGQGNLNLAFGTKICEGSILFNSSSGYFHLLDLLKLNGNLILENGHLIANEKLISAEKLIKKSNSNFDLNLESCNLNISQLIDVTNGLRISGNYSELKCASTAAFDSSVFHNLRIYDPNQTFAATINSVVIVDSVSCNGLSDGSFLVTFTVNGAQAVPPYHLTFQPGGITFSNVTSPFLATGLPGTNYTVRLFNTATAFPPGTQIALSAGNIMYEPSLFGVNYDALISPLCNGDCNGEIQFDVDGGNPNYNVVVNPGNHVINGLDRITIDSIENLCANTYTVNITDRKNCFYSETVILSEPTVVVPNEDATDQTCFGVCNSSVWVAPSGGTPFSTTQSNGLLYNVIWDGNVALTNDSINNLCPGTHTFIVTDSNSCSIPGSITISPVNQITFTPSSPSPISCADVSDGTANVSAVAGGTTPYTFSWSGPCVPTVVNTLTSSTASNMCAGSYTVTITDAAGCDTTQTFTITAPALLVGSVASTDVSCSGGNDGSATASQVGGTGPGFTHAWYSAANPVGGAPMVANAVSVNNLSVGTYTMIVVDAGGCNDTVTFVINEPLPLVITLTPTDPSCFGSTDGQICASSAGGTGAVTYTWSPVGGTVAANCYTNLTAGNYTADATDANGCPASASITLTSPPQINISVATTDPSCDNSCDGTAIATPSGGNGAPYTYSWSCAADVDSTVTGLCAISCTVTVNDALGCSATSNFSLTDPSPLTVTLTNTPINCFGASTAQIASLVGGGTPPYTYAWTGLPDVTPGLSNVPAGTYTLTVTDANNCTQTGTITITQPLPITITTTPVNPTCNGDCDGTISTLLSGGTAPYTVLWVPTNSTNLNLANLCAGSYTITVTDSRSCVMKDTIDLVDITSITVDVDSTNASCLGTCDGTATATPSGGNGGYTYQWDDPSNQTSQTATSLCAGSYNVIVTDVTGCTGSGTITVNEPSALSVSVGNITPSCSNICTGTADITASGGTAAYSYSLDGGASFVSTNLSGLCAGTHTVDVTDANGCTASTTFTVNPKVLVVVTSTNTTLTCNGDCSGSATANVIGGTAPIVYQWDLQPPSAPTPQATSSVSNLCAGTHSITVSDGIGCIVSSTVTFTEPTVLSGPVSATSVDCSGNCSGAATVTPSGGTSPYTVTWSEGTVGVTASNLCQGTYTATVTDANGCTIAPTANITQPSALTVSDVSTNPSVCGGSDGSIVLTPAGGSGSYSYSWTPVIDLDNTLSGVSSGVYTVTITDGSGCDTTLNYALSDPGGPTTTQNATNVTCPGSCNGTGTVDVTASTGAATVTWPGGLPSGSPPQSNFALCAGIYNVQVSDASGCLTFETITITEPAAFVENPVLTNLTCNGDASGSIVLNVTGGTPFYIYTVDGFSDDNNMTGLTAGTHTVIITDSQFCTDSITYVITEPAVLDVTETHTSVNCTTNVGSATATASGGTLPYSYSWSNGANTATAANLSPGTYTCTVTDGHGCTDNVTVDIQPNTALTSGFTFTDNQCATGCTGTASFSASGGSGTYTYSWNYTASTASSQTGICVGSYTAIVSDDNGCSVTETFTISTSPSMTVTLTGTNPTCNGTNTGSITTVVAGGTAAYSYDWSPIVSTLQNPTNLPSGSYTVDVTDANGCTTTANITLTDNAVLLSSATPTQPNCFGDCNGFIVSSPVGGTAPYTYAWGPNPISVNDTLSNLCIGTYSVVVTDFNGCTDTTSVNLTQPPQVGLIASVSPATCGAIPCDGSIVINNIIGNSVVWLNSTPPGFTGLSQTNLCAGIYDIEVSDANSCKDTVSFGVSNNTGPIVDVDSTDVTCIGNCDGTATVVSVSGNSPFSYSWGAPITDLDSIAAGLCVGSYLSQVTDAINCVTITSITVNQPLPLDDHEVITDATCVGLSDGCISLAPTGGTPPYNYVWSNGAPNNPTNCNLPPGFYTVDITDANGCSTSFSYNVGSNTQLSYLLTVTNNACFGQCNGTATLNNITGGTAPYTYTWNDGQSGLVANGLCAGSYSVTITDNIGCLRVVDTTITEPAQLSANPTVTNTACGVCAGSIAMSPTGGTGAYTYDWSNGQTNSTSTNLCAGIYMVDVTDGAGCVTQFSIAVNNTSGPSVSTTVTDVNCAGQCTGAATVTAVGGTAPYQYNWISGGQTTASVSSMCAGTYFVQVKDASNCVVNDTVVIVETTNLLANAAITPTDCGVCTGGITLTPSGGTAPYTYAWSNGLPANSSQSNLCAGSYTVEITDNLGCKDTNFISINSTNAPVVSVATDSVDCNGGTDGNATLTLAGGNSPYTVSWSTGSAANPTESNLSAGNYNVIVTDAGGCVSVKNFTIEEPSPISLSLNNTQLPNCAAVCNGALTAIPSGGTLPYAYLWSPTGATTDTIKNVCAGVYNVSITDAHGCSSAQTTTLNNSPNPFTITPTNVNATCGSCDGSSSLAVSGGFTPYVFSWSNGSNTSSSSNLCAGVYMVDVTDSIGCAVQYSVAISNTNAPTISVTTTDVNCAGSCTGSATAVASGGTTPYQYNWISGGQTSASLTNMCAGTYFVQVKDANNCTSTQQVDILELTALTANASSTLATCGVCDGTGSVSPTGGSGNYSYQWPGALPATASQTGLCAGTYSVIITDNTLGCSDTAFVNVSSTNAPSVTVDVDSVSCSSLSDGQATLTISGGTSPYTVLWSTGSAANPLLTGLAAGTYAVSVTDALSCVTAQNFVIDEPSAVSLSLNNTQLPNCNAVCNGALTAIPNGGVLPYSYSWSPGGAITDTLTNLCSGSYTVNVTDANGCSVSQTTLLNPNPTPFTVSSAVTEPACNQCNGLIDLSIVGGSSPYDYVWSTGDTIEDIANVCAGVYNVNIVDSMGCDQTVSLTISNINGITGDSSNVTNETCFGTCDGTAAVFPIGGTPGYTYLWLHDNSTTSSLTGLCAGTYFVEITDTNGCIRATQVDIQTPTQMIAIPSVVSPTCGASDGSITLNVSGGTGALTYTWAPAVAGNTNSATNLGAGSYTVTVQDAATTPCSQTFTVNLSNSNGPLVSVSTVDISCYGLCNGSINLNITSPNPTTVLWNTGSASNPFTSLCEGNYSAIITDNVTGCVTGINTSIIEPDTLMFSIANVVEPLCFGDCTGTINSIPSGGTLPYTFSWAPVSGNTPNQDSLCANTYSLTVTDQNGCLATQTTVINTPTDISVTGLVTDASCSGVANGAIDVTVSGGTPNTIAPLYAYQWSGGSTAVSEDLNAILFGTYTLVVTDVNLCTDTSTYNVAATDTVIANAGTDATFCIGGNQLLDGSASSVDNGTITFEWQNVPTTGILGTNDSLIVTPSSGTNTYLLIVTNSLGCADSDTVVLVANPLPTASAGNDQEIFYGQTVVIGGSPTGPVGSTVIWTPITGLDVDTIQNPTSSAITTTTYYVTVTDTATGCMSMDSMIVTVLPTIIIPNGISPNGDGKNDVWIIDAINKFPNSEVEVYNRWGELLYSKTGYDNTWGGTYNGKLLPIGTYYYVVKLNDPLYPDIYTGPITIFK